MESYKTIVGRASFEFTERHSKFIGYACSTVTEEEAVSFINEIRSKHSDANHNIYAYTLRNNNLSRFSDDGEPHRTAGKPALDIINGLELKDTTVVVTRYFGGILLGTGGLVRAYSRAVKEALDLAEKVLMVPGVLFSSKCDYNQYSKLESTINSYNGDIKETLFEDKVVIKYSIDLNLKDKFEAAISEAFSSTVFCENCGNIYTKQKLL